MQGTLSKGEKMIIKKFNLIEIALSLGILAIGLTAIVSLFPLGFQEIRDSIGENYSSEAADSMLAYIARESYKDWDPLFDGNGDGSGANCLIPSDDSKPVIASSGTLDPSSWGTAVEGDIFSITDPNATPSTTNGIFGLKVMSGDGSISDFTGEVLLWKSNVENIRAAGQNIDFLEYNEAVALHLEISWPVEKPYNQRKKNMFYFELFNYNQTP